MRPVAFARFESLTIILEVRGVWSWRSVVRVVVVCDLHRRDRMVLWLLGPWWRLHVLAFNCLGRIVS